MAALAVLTTEAQRRHRASQRSLRGSLCKLGVPVVILSVLFALPTTQAASDPQKVLLELRGRIVKPDGSELPFRPFVRVALQGVAYPRSESQLTIRGHFRFRKLTPGTYVLLALVRGYGEVHQSVEVSPSLAKKNRVEVEVRLSESTAALKRGAIVSVRELGIPARARDELLRAFQDLRAPRGEKSESAIRHLQKAISIAPRFVEAINLLGTVYYQRRELKKAEECFRSALEIDAASYYPLVNLGGVLINLSKYAEALPINQKAVGAQPDDPLAQAQLGYTWFALGHYQAAIVCLLRVKEADPNHFSFPQLTLAEIYLRQGRRQEAAAELEDFVKRHPDQAAAARARDSLPNLQKLAKEREAKQ